MAALLAASAALQQAAAVTVTSTEEFLAAVQSGDETIEVTEHLYLNTDEATAVADITSNQGYLCTLRGTQRTITVRTKQS